jgi:hypothetical protein
MAIVTAKINSFSLQSSTVVSSRMLHDSAPEQELNLLKITRRDGQKLISATYKPKSITFVGQIKGSTQDELEANIDTFKRYVEITEGNLDIAYSGSYRRYKVACLSVTIERARAHLTYAPFTLTFLVYDPPLAKEVNALGGNLVVQEALSVQQITTQSYETTITFDGSAKPKPAIDFVLDTVGALTDISFKNETTGQQISIGTSWSNSDRLTVDTDNATVQRGGIDIDFSGIFPEFDLGANKVLVTLTDAAQLNQSQTATDSDAPTSSNYIEEAQTFTPSSSTNYNRVDLSLRRGLETTASQTETFDTTGKKDVANTTGSWDTANGVASLAVGAAATDQSQLTGGSAFGFGLGSGNPNYIAQSFVPSRTSPLSSLILSMYKTNSPTDNIVVSVMTDNNGNPDAVLETVTFAGSSLTGSPANVTVTFAGTTILTKSSRYWFRVSRSGATSLTNSYGIASSPGSSDLYASGTMKTSTNGSSWTVQDNYDLVFTEKSPQYTIASNIIQSLGYDTNQTANIFTVGQANATLNGGTVTAEFSDSANNSSWGSWTADITTLSLRYIRFRLTITGTVNDSPLIDSVTMTYHGKFQASLMNTSGGLPTTTIEALQIDIATLGDSYGISTLNFTSVALTSGTVYAIAIVPLAPGLTVTAAYKNANVYANGQRARRTSSGGSWTGFSTNDLIFYLYKTPSANWSVDTRVTYVERYF